MRKAESRDSLSLRELAHLFHFTEKGSLALVGEVQGLHNTPPVKFRNRVYQVAPAKSIEHLSELVWIHSEGGM